jgi:hypothetical protein
MEQVAIQIVDTILIWEIIVRPLIKHFLYPKKFRDKED